MGPADRRMSKAG